MDEQVFSLFWRFYFSLVAKIDYCIFKSLQFIYQFRKYTIVAGMHIANKLLECLFCLGKLQMFLKSVCYYLRKQMCINSSHVFLLLHHFG